VLLGRVVGRLWAARQASTLGGRKLLLVQPESASSARGGGAEAPSRLIVAHGSRVRDLTVGADVADKDVVIAIVDDLEIAP